MPIRKPRQPSISNEIESSAAGSVVLRGERLHLNTLAGQHFVTDCARHIEGCLSESDIKNKWGLSDLAWQRLADNVKLLSAVSRAREQRILNGDAAREGAQQGLANAPAVLADILANEKLSPRHRIEAARELRQAAGSGDLPVSSREAFVISINLGGDDCLTYEVPGTQRNISNNDDGDPS